MLSPTLFRVVAYKAWKRLLAFNLRGIPTTVKSQFSQIRQASTSVDLDSFDNRWGVDTGGIVPLYRLRIQSRNDIHGVKYQASSPELFYQLMSAIKVAYEDFVFIDLGSGKGRVLLLASELPFKRIIGIEFSQELIQIARTNFERRAPTQRPIELLWMDAADYEFPEEKSIIYLYNPFDEKVLKRVIDNLRLSLLRHPREVYIVYTNPIHARVIAEAKLFVQVLLKDEAAVFAHPFLWRYDGQ